jgi:hypothetical protein
MSRVKPYKAKMRIADYAALQRARNEAVYQYRQGLMEFFDRKRITDPIQWNAGPGAFRALPIIQKTIEKAQYVAMAEEMHHHAAGQRMAWILKGVREGAAYKLAQYLMAEGFIKETVDEVHGYGKRLTFTIYVARDA